MAFGRLKVDEVETSTQVIDLDSLAGASGTVTSVGLVAPTGFSVSGSPVTTSGNITLSFAAGYSLPTTASQTNWDTAYTERLYWDGGATGLNAATGRTSLGLGSSATLNVGTTTGTVAAGDDSRFVPPGGTAGQSLIKSSGTDYDADWATPITAIDGLTDVTITSAADGEVLTYDSATGQWINSAPSGGGGTPGGTSGQLQWNSSGTFAGVGGSTVGATGDITLSLNGAAGTPPLKLTGTWFSSGTSTTTKPQLLIEPNGTTSTAWSTSGTGLGVNAASGFSGNLLDLQKDGTSLVRVNSSGTINDAINFRATYIEFLYSGTVRGIAGVDDGAAMFKLPDSGFFGWAPSAAVNATYDLALFRDAAGTLAQRNGTNAQTYRLYNTYTDASNYERAKLSWNSNVFEIGTEGAGTGSEKPLRITAATLKLPNLPTYADNAAATAGGLVAGDVYKTATGELRITV